ncbi:MAG: phospholipid carrier-dependent glycosyltransferase [Ruminococcaceae bacterium]|nr:phospholipid carrier-dependent glycosyltransferase [Oscillospiraceae bacterium]
MQRIIGQDKENKKIVNIVFFAFVIRLLVLIFILTIGQKLSEPYFIADDIKYDDSAKFYLKYAKDVFDRDVLNAVTEGYYEPFWPSFMCITSAFFGTVYAARFFNILFSTLCVKVIYDIVNIISNNIKTSLRAAKLFAFLPVTILTSCFPIKDIFLTLTVFFTFYVFLKIQNGKKVTIANIILLVIGLVCTFYTRGAVVEMLILFFVICYVHKFIKEKKYGIAFIIGIVSLLLFAMFYDNIMAAFDTKISDYGGESKDAGNIAYLNINSIFDIYKLPFTYMFANLQPIRINFFSFSNERLWYNLITLLNVSIYPVAISSFLYIFCKKNNFIFWFLGFVMYSSVIILSLGVFRHYLFLLPFGIINCSLWLDEDEIKTKNKGFILFLCSFLLFAAILAYSVFKNYTTNTF